MVSEKEILKRAMDYHQKQSYEKAKELYLKIINQNPSNSNAFHLFGLLMYQMGNLELALQNILKAIELNPNNFGYYLNLGIVYKAKNDFKNTILSYEKAISLNSNFAEAYNNLANIYKEQRDSNKAITLYQKALSINPNYVEAYNNLGVIFQEKKDLKRAIEYYEIALKLNPNYPQTYNNLANILKEKNEIDKAISFYEKAISLNPNFAEAYTNLAIALSMINRLREAKETYKKALSINPNLIGARDYLFELELKSCDWSSIDTMRHDLIEPVLKNENLYIRPFNAIGYPLEITNEERLIIANRYLNNVILPKIKGINLTFKFEKIDKPIRIGYVTPNLYNHPTMHLIRGLFKRHNRDKFKVYLYSLYHKEESEYFQRAKDEVDIFRDIKDLSLIESVKVIYEDKIDILIDLNGYTQNTKMEIFALKPAPIQVSYLGYPSTTGAQFIDYLITDKIITPPSYQKDFNSTFAYMPHSYMITDNEQKVNSYTPTKEELSLPKDKFIFCSFNNDYKIEPKIFNVWMNILKRVKNSIIWIYATNEVMKENLQKEAIKRGVEKERLIFAKKLPKDEHLARLKVADLFLDTYSYNAHTTAIDALYINLPILTCKGNSFASRVSSSFLNTLGLSELITFNLNEYEELAVELATNRDKFELIKSKLKEAREKSPLFDTNLFVKNLEELYLNMVDEYNKKFIS